jgi:hypothetical protein
VAQATSRAVRNSSVNFLIAIFIFIGIGNDCVNSGVDIKRVYRFYRCCRIELIKKSRLARYCNVVVRGFMKYVPVFHPGPGGLGPAFGSSKLLPAIL